MMMRRGLVLVPPSLRSAAAAGIHFLTTTSSGAGASPPGFRRLGPPSLRSAAAGIRFLTTTTAGAGASPSGFRRFVLKVGQARYALTGQLLKWLDPVAAVIPPTEGELYEAGCNVLSYFAYVAVIGATQLAFERRRRSSALDFLHEQEQHLERLWHKINEAEWHPREEQLEALSVIKNRLTEDDIQRYPILRELVSLTEAGSSGNSSPSQLTTADGAEDW